MSNDRTIIYGGGELALAGREIKVGDLAPDFEALDFRGRPFSLSGVRDRALLLHSIPSVELAPCARAIHRFDAEAARLGQVTPLAISMDLPWTLDRMRRESPTERVITLTDHRLAAFGQAYGMYIPELRLLASGVIVIGKDRVIRYVQMIPGLEQEPDYEAVVRAVQDLD